MWKYPGYLFIGMQITARWLLFNKYSYALILMSASIQLSRASVFNQKIKRRRRSDISSKYHLAGNLHGFNHFQFKVVF